MATRSTLPQRLARADTVILMMLPLWLCVWRALWRLVQFRGGRQRPDMAPGCEERIDFEFLAYIWNYRRQTLPKLEAAFAAHFAGTPIRLSRRKDVAAFMATVPDVAQPKIAPAPRQTT